MPEQSQFFLPPVISIFLVLDCKYSCHTDNACALTQKDKADSTGIYIRSKRTALSSGLTEMLNYMFKYIEQWA
jgi:hypothetical protein